MSEPEPLVIALDAEGGDHGAGVLVPAAADVLAEMPALRVLVAGRPQALEPVLADLTAATRERFELLPAERVLAPADGARAALRHGAASSLRLALDAVRDGRAAACVSAGNTAALLALGRRSLGLLPGIERPALMTALPSRTGATWLLDLGANLSVNARQLAQFAVMGSVTVAAVGGKPQARVGLLNVGHEEGKGHDLVREADRLLRDLPLNYVGFIEGDDVFSGKVDVAVCDGFTGNLVLKSSEGVARMLIGALRDAFSHDARGRVAGWFARPVLARLVRFDPAAHNGAPLLGLDGVLVKSHGAALRAATAQAIRVAVREARAQVPRRIGCLVKDMNLEHMV